MRIRTLCGRLLKKIQAIKPHTFSFSNISLTTSQSPFPFMVSKDNLLETLGAKYQPTKRLHNYLAYYWMHFRDIRLEVKKVLEIGIGTGVSLRMWEEFFPNATIYGIDLNPRCKEFEGERRKVLIGDQANRHFLEQVIQQTKGALDIIIDDGSHLMEHQLKSFEFLFPAMSDHGIYVIEDTGFRDFNLETVHSLKALVDPIMYWPKGFKQRDWPYLTHFPNGASWIDKHIIGIAFYRWIVFIMRGKNPQDNPFLTPLPADLSLKTKNERDKTTSEPVLVSGD